MRIFSFARFLFTVVMVVGIVGIALQAQAQDAPPSQTLFTNVNIFDGKNDRLVTGMNVLIEGNLIKQVGANLKAPDGASIIDGGGRTLMPGLIEGHGHLQLNGTSLADIENNRNLEELAVRSVAKAEMALTSGFTTWRDAGGMGAGLRKSIDAGLVIGPRIYPSGAFLGPTGSHADFRNFTTPNETVYGSNSSGSRNGLTFTADGVDMIKTGARQNFMQGATQIKIMSSGGVASAFDPWQLDAYSAEEIRAAVEVADAYGSYVMSHAYSKVSMIRCLENGVKTLEHAFMFDGDIAKLMKEKGAYMTTNMHAFSPELGKIEAISSSPAAARKAETAQAAFDDFIKNVNEYQPKFGFNADCVGGVESCKKQTDHEIFLIAKFLGNFFALKAMTSVNGEIMALSGNTLNPYYEAKLGVIESGAYADILVVDGNPLEDITVIGGNEKWFDAPDRDGIETIRLIMKDGKIYKNTLPGTAVASRDEDAKTISARLTVDGRIAIYGVQFETGSDEIIKASAGTLSAIVDALNAKPELKIAVVGHTDDVGGHEQNLELSKRRADAVVAELIKAHGIADDRLFAAGASFLSPVGSNESEEGRALNRRVELVRMK